VDRSARLGVEGAGNVVRAGRGGSVRRARGHGVAAVARVSSARLR
jgi:hypothetical protein